MSKKTIKCKSCSNDVSSKAKVCPNCGSKIKKPIYKKWWFWLVIAILFIAVVSGGGDDENVAESGEPTTVVDETKAFEGDSAELTIGENTNLNTIEESKKEKNKQQQKTLLIKQSIKKQ
ncbi:MAG: zinc ribbon domain-containing protein [Clostridia bacterium]|nr:zinc ribbon domain-containing protein [Clostridia bacterium]